MAIADYGAEIVRIDGSYDDAVRRADTDATLGHRLVVSDTSYPGYEDIPRHVMQGYSVLVEEALLQLEGSLPTHVFIQAGVGGLAAAVAAYLWESYGADRPTFVIAEPQGAACLFETVRAGEVTRFRGELDTIMGCLSCAEPSPLAWRILEHAADFAATIPDELAIDGMKLLIAGVNGDAPIVAGESAVAGVMAAHELARDPVSRQKVGLTTESRLLFIGTEGATDPEIYAELVEINPDNPNSAAAELAAHATSNCTRPHRRS
jgi:diaminopropionate ammonia-lyase